MLKLKNSLKIFFLAFIFTYYLLPITYYLYAQDKIIAIVNNEVITEKDLDDFMNFMRLELSQQYPEQVAEQKIQEMKPDLLNKLIEDRLILQEAKKNSLKIDESRVKAKIGEIRKQYYSDIEFQNALAKQGFVQADLEEKIREQLLTFLVIDLAVRSKINLTPFEITDYYQKNLEQFVTPQIWEYDTIAITSQVLAEEISGRLKKGESLEKLAAQYGLGIDKIKVGKAEGLKKDIEDIIFKLEKDKASLPVKIQDKYYIFRLNAIIPPQQEALREVQDKIYLLLVNQKMEEALVKWLEEVKRGSYIKMMQDEP